GTLVSANDSGAGSCGGGGGGDVVYSFTLSQPQRVQSTVTPAGGGFTPVLYLQSPCGSSTGEPADGCGVGSGSLPGTLRAPFLPAGSYSLWVDSAGGSDSNFTIAVKLFTAVSPPPNRTCATAQSLTLNATPIAGDTTGSVNTYHPICALPPDARDVAYQF